MHNPGQSSTARIMTERISKGRKNVEWALGEIGHFKVVHWCQWSCPRYCLSFPSFPRHCACCVPVLLCTVAMPGPSYLSSSLLPLCGLSTTSDTFARFRCPPHPPCLHIPELFYVMSYKRREEVAWLMPWRCACPWRSS